MRRWAAPLAWALFVFVASTVPSFGQLPVGRWGADKLIHFCEYLILGYLVVGAVRSSAGSAAAPDAGGSVERGSGRRRPAAIGLALCAAWAVLDEAHQALVPNRHPEALDLVCDIAGSTVGIHVRLLRYRFRAHAPKGDP
jgi:VanZ family protein